MNAQLYRTGRSGPSDATKAVLLIVLSAFCFAGSHAGAKYLTQEMHPFVAAFWRNLFAFAPFIPWIARNGVQSMHTERFGLHMVRALVNATAVMLWFMALSLMPLGDATALSMTGPLFTMAFAALFLGEAVGPRRWSALAFGMAGALVIIRPGFETVSLGALLVILRGVMQGTNKVMVKRLTRTDEPGVIVAYVLLLSCPITLAPALLYWQWPSLEALAVLVVVGGIGAAANISMVTAYKLADVSLIEPLTFTRLVWASIIAWLLFAEIPQVWTWLGGAMIVAATSYIAHREALAKKTKKTA